MRIGWIGLGKMGIPMSLQLVKAGYPLSVYNRNKEMQASLLLAGASTGSSPQSIIQQSDIIFLMVSDDTATREIFEANNGLLAAKATGKIIINMSSVSPLISKEMSALCAQQGNQYMDAPVSGSVKQAQEGQLVIMCGGEAVTFESAKTLLEVMGKLVLHVGPTGAGNIAKLAINTLLGFYAQGLAEAVVLAEKNGIKTSDLMTLLNNGALSNIFTKIKGDAILQDNYTAAFALKHIVKDVGLAKDIGLSTPLGNTMLQTFVEAAKEFGEEDIIAVIKHLR